MDKGIAWKKTYSNLPHAGAFAGLRSFYRLAKKHNPRVTYDQVKESAQAIDSYTLHKPRRYKFARNCFILTDIDDLRQVDLADLSGI